MATLKDIANYVGVSISTVSRVINNDTSRHISEETKRKVWKAVHELGYEPNKSARQLVKKKKEEFKPSKQIGCIVSVPQNKYNHPYFSPILAGIEKALADMGYSLSYIHTREDLRNEAILHKVIHEVPIDGMIVVEGIDRDLYDYIKKHVPAIVGIDLFDQNVPVVSYDRIAAAKSAVRHLITQGHRKIGFIGGAGLSGDMEREKRFRGYKSALEEAGLELNPKWIINANWDVDKSYQGMSQLLKEDRKEWPTAVFAASDMMAISAMRAVTEKNLSIPEDMAFIGVDNIEISQYTSPPLSSVHIPKFEMGAIAAKLLIDGLQGNYPLHFKVIVPFEIIVRRSSDYKKM